MICPICNKKGTTHHKIEFYTCDKHTANEVYKQLVEDLGGGE